MTNQEIQIFLRDKGLYSGALDGVLGPKSRQAMRDLLDQHHWSTKRLRVGTMQVMCRDQRGIDPGPIDGLMGPMTRGALSAYRAEQDGDLADPDPSDPLARSMQSTMPWLERAQELLGVREIKGKRHNPVIMGWAKAQKIWYPNDETPWCGLLVSHCFHHTVPTEAQPAKPLGARNWGGFGQACDAQLGSVLTFWRGSPEGWSGHVGFYVGEDRKAYHVLGGNQSDEVNVKRVSKDRFLKSRWPNLGGEPPGIKRRLDARGRLSNNEA